MRLQNALPQARIVYSSATGASAIDGLCYASRLGLWGTPETPFPARTDFVQAMDAGGVAALEVVARDCKALGRYQARALSYTGVEVDILEHVLTDEQTAIYNEYARAFKIIHHNLGAALEATGIDTGDVCNARAKAAARSAFELAKQRFFSHLLTSMKCPTLIASIEDDLRNDFAPVVQIVSTGEALTERRISQIPTSEWDDLSVDLTPREYVLDYLMHAFPVNLHEEYEDEEGNSHTRPVRDKDGNPVLSQEAVDLRDALVEKLASMPPIGAALDQLLHHFGHDDVAEVTGRSRRVLRISDDGRGDRLAVRNRPASANLHETQAFMDGKKRLLVFSGAGNTGRSYHADLACANTKRRRHYLLEAGWQANQAIQGLGRTHRTRQKSAPLFSPVTTNVKGERRFTSTIARRIHSLGAITRGQKDSQSGMGDDNAALFRECDNFESEYARAALRAFYHDLYAGRIEDWSADSFEEETGLSVVDSEGQLLTDLPPMHTFLNRLLALEIHEQNHLFAHLEQLVDANIEGAIQAGTYNRGVERITAAGLELVATETAEAPGGASVHLVEILRRDRLRPTTVGTALEIYAAENASQGTGAVLLRNTRSGNVALCTTAPSQTLEDGTIQKRRRIIQPASRRTPAPGGPQDRLEADRDRRVARGVDRTVRRAPGVPRVPLLARHRRAAANLEEAPGNRRPGLPPHDRLRDGPDRQGPDGRPDGRRAHEARPRQVRRREADPPRTNGGAHGPPLQVPPRRRPRALRPPPHGSRARRDRAPRPRDRGAAEDARVRDGDRPVPGARVRPPTRPRSAGSSTPTPSSSATRPTDRRPHGCHKRSESTAATGGTPHARPSEPSGGATSSRSRPCSTRPASTTRTSARPSAASVA